MMLFQVKLSHISNPRSHQLTMDHLPSLLERPSRKLLRTQPKMFSLNTTPHGADTARSLHQSGMSSLNSTKTNQTLLLPNSMPPSTRPRELRLRDTQPSSSIQRIIRMEL